MNKFFKIALITLLFLIPLPSLARKATLINYKTDDKVVVDSGSQLAQIFFGKGYTLFKEQKLGFNIITDFQTTLSASMTSSQSTLPLSSIKTKEGHTIVMTDLGNKAYFTIEPGATKEEIVVCTGISGSSFTGCTRGLAFYGTSEVAVAANQKTHNAGSVIVMSNVQYVYKNFVDKDTNETIAGIKTFSSLPLVPTTTPTTTDQVASKSYADSLAYVGSPNAAEGTKGIVDLATKAQMAAGTSVGVSSSKLVLQSGYASSTSSATNIIPVTLATGLLDDSFVNHAGQTFTGTTTINILSAATSTFSVIPTIPTTTPTVDTDVTSKLYVDTQVATKSAFGAFGTSTTKILNAGNQTSFTDVDVSSIVGAKSSLLFMLASCSGANDKMTLRTNGEIDTFESPNGATALGWVNAIQFTTAANKGYIMVQTSNAGVFEYKVSADSCSLWLQSYIN